MEKKKEAKKEIKKQESGKKFVSEIPSAPAIKIKPSTKKAKEYPTLHLAKEHEIAYDFAVKAYEKFNKIIKSVVLFGSSAKRLAVSGSDIDIVIIIDDCSILWDQELIAWYREELAKIIQANPYQKALHINTVRLSTWWSDMIRGDPVIINIIRWGEPLIDFGGFFVPLKVLLQQGKIKSTPEAVYTALQRAPAHMLRSKIAILGAIEGLYWACVDSSHAALMAAKQLPPSPEDIPRMLKEQFADKKLLDRKYISGYADLFTLAHKILHGEVKEIRAEEISIWQKRTDEFVGVMARLVKEII